MTKDEFHSKIRTLTKRIGAAKSTGATEEVERIRLLRFALMEALAREHDSWTLINAEGKSEFVDQETFLRRAKAWVERKRAEQRDSA